MQLKYTLLATAALVGGAIAYVVHPLATTQAVTSAPAIVEPRRLAAGAGRVEPASEEVRVGSELDGKLRAVLVDEGQQVRRGQTIAVLHNADFEARVTVAEANVKQREASLDRIVNGARKQERRESDASVREADAILASTAAERARRQELLAKGAVSRAEFDSADREYLVAKARLEAVRERQSMIHDDARAEDVAHARAEIDWAKGQLAEAKALLEKTYVRSPIDGIVLQRKLKSGESVSAKGGDPIVILGDTARLRVRVDIDEADVARLAVGQTAWVTAPAYGAKKFAGTVVRVGQSLGRKNIRTDEPTERVDTKILETLVELEAGQKLPIGLRVDAFVETAQ